MAVKHINSWIDDETGDVIELYLVNNKLVMRVYHTDGTMEVWKESNPNPDDSGKGTSEPDVVALLKKAQDAYREHLNAEETPLGEWITRDGGGKGPHWNPGDEDDSTGPGAAPGSGLSDYDKTAKEKLDELRAQNAEARGRQIIGTSMGSGEEGGSETAPGPDNHGSSKGDDSNEGSYKDRQNKTIGDTYDLGPRPDLINPDPRGKLGGTKVGGG